MNKEKKAIIDKYRDLYEPLPRQVPQIELEDCDVCGAETVAVHCKIVCVVCGYRRDCSDP